MARKKEDKDGKYKRITNKLKKSSRDNKEVDADVIKSQLLTLGLTLREVPGDGYVLVIIYNFRDNNLVIT